MGKCNDSWMGQDKVKHLLVCIAIAVVHPVLGVLAATIKGGYDYVYAAQMCRADLLGSSVPDEQHLALYVKDTCDDVDGGDGVVMRRWYASMVGGGEPVEWEDLLEDE